jgi:hypothetical protein
MTVKRCFCLVAALLLVPAVAAADDLSATLSGAGGAQGLASIVTGNGTVSYSILTNGIGNVTDAEIRQGGTVFVDLNASSASGAAAGQVATGANLAALNDAPGNFTVRVAGTGGTVEGPLASAGGSTGPETNPGTLGFAMAEADGLERDGTVTLVVTRTGGTDGAVSVDYATADGTATAGDDYTAANGTLTWIDGDGVAKMIQVAILDDGNADADETFSVNLSNATGDASIGLAAATVTILDNDTPCVEGPNTLCLQQGRFEVTTSWATTQGTSGAGDAGDLGLTDTGYFTFFNVNNVEVVVKVLNGCPVNQRYWVFAGGLTNVEVELIVRDSETGVVQRYMNPQSTPFQPIQDTQAFATCP